MARDPGPRAVTRRLFPPMVCEVLLGSGSGLAPSCTPWRTTISVGKTLPARVRMVQPALCQAVPPAGRAVSAKMPRHDRMCVKQVLVFPRLTVYAMTDC